MLDESEILSEEQVNESIRLTTDPTERMLLLVLYYTGARISEVVGTDSSLALTPSRLIADKNLIKLINLKFKHCKKRCRSCLTNLKVGQNTCYCGSQDIESINNPPRWKNVLVPADFLILLNDYISYNKIGQDDPIFCFNRFKAWRIVRRAFKRIGIEGHPHQYRHAYIMKGIHNDVDLKFLQIQVGHKSGSMLFEYMAINSEQKKKELAKMFKPEP